MVETTELDNRFFFFVCPCICCCGGRGLSYNLVSFARRRYRRPCRRRRCRFVVVSVLPPVVVRVASVVFYVVFCNSKGKC